MAHNSPEQNGVLTVAADERVLDTIGPCMVAVTDNGDGNYSIGHFDNKKEFERFVREQMKKGKSVSAVPSYSAVNATAAKLFASGNIMKPKKRWF